MTTLYLIWSEEHGAWWVPGGGYTVSLRAAGRYSKNDADRIVFDANVFLKAGEWHEIAIPDPLTKEAVAK